MKELRTMNIMTVDPSMSLGFFLRSREDFDQLCNALEKLNTEIGNPAVTVAVSFEVIRYVGMTSTDVFLSTIIEILIMCAFFGCLLYIWRDACNVI